MTRRISLFFVLFLYSCSVVNISDYPSIAKTILFGVDEVLIDERFYSEMKYSFAVVNIGKYKKSILILASISGEEYLWVGSNAEKVITVNGKIQKSYGLDHDIKFISGSSFSFNSNLNEYSSLMQLENPKALVDIKYNLHFVSDELNVFNPSLEMNTSVNGKHKKFVETYVAQSIDWKGVNNYWINENGRVVKTIQSYHPLEPNVEITFYYK